MRFRNGPLHSRLPTEQSDTSPCLLNDHSVRHAVEPSVLTCLLLERLQALCCMASCAVATPVLIPVTCMCLCTGRPSHWSCRVIGFFCVLLSRLCCIWYAAYPICLQVTCLSHLLCQAFSGFQRCGPSMFGRNWLTEAASLGGQAGHAPRWVLCTGKADLERTWNRPGTKRQPSSRRTWLACGACQEQC